MPVYEYQCLDESCNCGFSSLESMDSPNPPCKQCGGETKKLISAPMVHFKGTGWYQTDFADRKQHTKPSERFSKDLGEGKITPRKLRTD